MIKSFLHKGLKNFYHTGSKAGIQARHADKLARILARLEVAATRTIWTLPAIACIP